MPPPLVELAVGIVAALLFLALRVALTPIAGDRSPYAFVFLSVVVACVAAGWRSGLVALLIGQVLTWNFVVETRFAFGAPPDAKLGGLAIATLSQLVVLAIIALYQREVAKGTIEGERRMEVLDQARREIDHRAKNNYQTVLSLIQLQATREADAGARRALEQVADRISALSLATEHLAIRSEDLATVKLRDHLCELCAQLERGLARGEVRVECDMADVTASADTAVHLAIIVNELVTNALKHAFEEGGGGTVRVRSQAAGPGLIIEVSDDGCGMKGQSPSSGSGLGMKLVETFARHLNAAHEVTVPGSGTVHRLTIPDLE